MACFAYRDEARMLGIDPAGASMPFAEPGVQPHYAPSWTFVIEHAAVRLDLDPEAHSYTGVTTFEVRPLPTYTGELRFDLTGVPVTSVTDDAGRSLAYRLEDDAIVVVAGDARRVTIAYGGHAPPAGLYFTGPCPGAEDRPHMAWTQCQDEDAHFFMPCLDHPRIRHPWTIELTGPAGSTLLSNGAEVSVHTEGDRVTARFEQVEGMPAYLFTAVCGPLHVTEATWRGRPVRYFVPFGQEEPVARSMGRTPEMMDVFSAFTGVDYPWPRYDTVVVHDFVFGGMENTACTTMTDVLLIDDKVLPHWDPEGLVCHELAHQWFGDLVTCQDWSQGWLNESWATFMETVWCEHRHGEAATAWYAFEQARSYLDEDSGRYRRPIQSYDFKEPIDVFDRHLYEKGAVVLRTLRHELGDAAFRAGVTHYLTRHAHQPVHGRDFQRAMEDATGVNLDAFVHQWILGAGHPVLDVSLGEEPGLLTVGITQKQEGQATAGAFQLRLRVEAVLADGTVQVVTLPVAERERAWAIAVPQPVVAVRVDPGFRMLAEIHLAGPERWLLAASRDACPVLAARAVEGLMRRNTPAAVAGVVAALRTHPFWGVRADAARALGKRGGQDDRDVLLEALGKEEEPRVRVAVIKALGAFRDAKVADALLAALHARPSTWYVHGELLESLGRTRDPRALTTLPQHLDVGGTGDVVVQRALVGLAHTQDPAAVDLILAVSKEPRGDRAISGAARALGVLGDQVDAVRSRCTERLLELLLEGGFRTRLAALGALGQLKDPASVDRLERVHASAPDGRIRRMAWEALVRVRKGRSSEEGLAGLRERLDALAAENQKLRVRLDKLEGAPS